MTLTYSPRVGTAVWLDGSTPATVTREADLPLYRESLPIPHPTVIRVDDEEEQTVNAERLILRHIGVDELAEVRRLQLLGVPPEVIGPLVDYVNALNRCEVDRANTASHGFRSYYGVDPEQTAAAKYLQIVAADDPGVSQGRSVHSVVIKETGEVCKPAGWRKGPAKSTSKARKGQPLVAYTLTDPDSYAAMLAHLDPHGGYLYSK